MKKALRNTLMISMMSVLVACGGPKLNGKNEMAFEESFKGIVMELSQTEAQQFARDIQTIGASFSGLHSPEDYLNLDLSKLQENTEKMLKVLDGKTVKDVRKMANKISEQG